MKAMIMKYRLLIVVVFINMLLLFIEPSLGNKSLEITGGNLLQMLSVLPPIFILLGLMDVWVPRETIMKYMGEKSGLVGISLAFFLGSAAAGPLYAAFPVAGMLLKKGSKFSNVLILIGAWSTTKIPMLIFEATSMGGDFMLTRLALDIVGVVVIAYIIEKAISVSEKENIYEAAKSFDQKVRS